MNWTSLDTWIVTAAVLSAGACALLGNFLVLRRHSLMGDAISHAVLPGLAVAFLVTGSRGSVAMFIGAAVVGLLTAVLTETVQRMGRVEQSAAMGVVFTTLFAIGLILIVSAADYVDLDPGCVLYGALELIPLDTMEGVTVWGAPVPRAVLMLGLVFLADLLFILGFWKELKISSFDPALATTLGINAGLMNYLLMMMVAVTAVAAFESVGSILVIAMLIVPAAAAHLLTDRLGVMVGLSLLIAALSAVLGHLGAITVPTWFGFTDTVTSGMMAVVAGLFFLLTVVFAPHHGLLARALHQWRLQWRILREDVLGLAWRMEETGTPCTVKHLSAALHASPLTGDLAVRMAGKWVIVGLVWQGYLSRRGEALVLTERGRSAAGDVVRSHRLWQRYLVRTGQAKEHLHEQAHLLEHATSSQLQQKLDESVRQSGHEKS